MDITVDYNPYVSNDLCTIMHKYGSDKGAPNNTGWHNYTTFYHALFSPIRNESLRVFELGLGTNNISLPSNMGANGKPGASLRAWREYFPNASVFGADIDKDILFNEDRIRTFYCDQLSPEIIKNMWTDSDLVDEFDIIIEDGLHTFEANKCFFENSIHKLKKRGVYIIEDINRESFDKINEEVEKWKDIYSSLIFRFIEIPGHNTWDNNLLVIQNT